MIRTILAALALTTALPFASPAFASEPVESRLDHISIVTFGNGSPVVLVPGLSSPRAVWDGVAANLAKSHRVYLVQVNGFGGDAPGANLKPGLLDGIVADLSSTLARDHAAPVRLVGHSMGGLVGLMFAKAHPDQIDRLMIVDSFPYIAAMFARGGAVPAVASITPIEGMMRDQFAARYGKPVDRSAVAAQVGGLAVTPAAKEKVTDWSVAADARVSGEALYEDMTTDLRAALPAIATSITLIVPTAGDADKTTAFYTDQYKGAPHLKLVPIANAGHFVMLDQPAAFAAALTTFVTP